MKRNTASSKIAATDRGSQPWQRQISGKRHSSGYVADNGTFITLTVAREHFTSTACIMANMRRNTISGANGHAGDSEN